jgi:hypothetical protein
MELQRLRETKAPRDEQPRQSFCNERFAGSWRTLKDDVFLSFEPVLPNPDRVFGDRRFA